MRIVGIAAALGLAGCVTSFTGAAKVKDGPAGCKAACAGWGMDLAGMVKMGEYSDGCICQVRPGAPGAPRASSDGSGAQAPGSQAVAGVWVQMQAAATAAAEQAAARRRAEDESAGRSSHPGAPNYRPTTP